MLPYFLLFSIILFLTPLDLCREFSRLQYFLGGIVCFLLASFAGMRTVGGDMNDYQIIFDAVPELTRFFNTDLSEIHGEIGFLLFISILKTIGLQINALYFIFPVISLSLLLISFKRNKIDFFFVALLVYFSRFFLGREMAQIRSAIACSTFLFTFKYIKDRSFFKFLISLLIASVFHSVALVGIPFYFLANKRLKIPYIFIFLFLSFLIGSIGIVTIFYSMFESILPSKIFLAYFLDETFAQKLGLANPTLIIQLMFFLIYTLTEKRLKNNIPYYYIIRNLYLFSICWLAIFNELSSFAGRISTFFATTELIVISSILCLFYKKSNLTLFVWTYFIVILFCVTVFYLNLEKLKDAYIPYETLFSN